MAGQLCEMIGKINDHVASGASLLVHCLVIYIFYTRIIMNKLKSIENCGEDRRKNGLRKVFVFDISLKYVAVTLCCWH